MILVAGVPVAAFRRVVRARRHPDSRLINYVPRLGWSASPKPSGRNTYGRSIDHTDENCIDQLIPKRLVGIRALSKDSQYYS